MVTGSRFLNALALMAALIACSSPAGAGEAGQADAPNTYPAAVSEVVAPANPGSTNESYGVALTPAVYLVNFLLLYVANPSVAANMPAYMASLPSPVYDCLEANPRGCPYADFSDLFGFNRSGDSNRRPNWPPACQEEPQLERLTPSIARFPDQLNEPLGAERANRLARVLGIDKSMVLTDAEYQCTIGTPREI